MEVRPGLLRLIACFAWALSLAPARVCASLTETVACLTDQLVESGAPEKDWYLGGYANPQLTFYQRVMLGMWAKSLRIASSDSRFAPVAKAIESQLARARPKCLGSMACISQFYTNGSLKPPTRQEVIGIAQQGLKDFEQGRPHAARFSAFFLGAESLGVDPASPQNYYYDASVQQILRLTGSREAAGNSISRSGQSERVREYMFSQGFQNYVSKSPELLGYTATGGGNCVAQTRLAAAVWMDAGIQVPQGWRFGLQELVGHRQPVLYNQSTGQVFEMITGTIYDKVYGRIVDPASVYRDYLNQQGIPVTIPPERFLIADMNAHYTPDAKQIATIQSLGASPRREIDDYGSYGPWPAMPNHIPDRATIPFSLPSSASEGSNGGGGRQHFAPTRREKLRSAALGTATGGLVSMIAYRQWFRGEVCDTGGLPFKEAPTHWGTLICFKSKADLKEFGNENLHSGRLQLLERIANRELAKISADPAYGRALELARNPEFASKLTPPEIAEATIVTQKTNEIFHQTFLAAIVTGEIKANPHEDAFMAQRSTYRSRLPVAQKLSEAISELESKMNRNPSSWVTWLDQLSPQSRRGLFELLRANARTQINDRLGNFFSYVADRSKLILLSEEKMLKIRGLQSEIRKLEDLPRHGKSDPPGLILWVYTSKEAKENEHKERQKRIWGDPDSPFLAGKDPAQSSRQATRGTAPGLLGQSEEKIKELREALLKLLGDAYVPGRMYISPETMAELVLYSSSQKQSWGSFANVLARWSPEVHAAYLQGLRGNPKMEKSFANTFSPKVLDLMRIHLKGETHYRGRWPANTRFKQVMSQPSTADYLPNGLGRDTSLSYPDYVVPEIVRLSNGLLQEK